MLKGHATVICCIYSDPERNEKTLCAIREQEKDGGAESTHIWEKDIYLLRGTQEMQVFY